MTKQELLNLYNTLNSLGSIKGAKFAYAVSKNLSLLSAEKEALDKAAAKSEEFSKLEQEFEPERIAIAEKYAKKDENGKAIKKTIQLGGQSVEVYDMEDQKASNEECEAALKAKNPKLYEERLKQLTDYANLLKEEVKIAFFPYVVKLADVPEDISAQQMNAIFSIVVE